MKAVTRKGQPLTCGWRFPCALTYIYIFDRLQENGRGTSSGSASVQDVHSETSLHSFSVFLPLHWKMTDLHSAHWKLSRFGSRGIYSLKWPIQGSEAGQGVVFVPSVLNRVYNFPAVLNRFCLNHKKGIACAIDLIWLMKFVCTSKQTNRIV